MKKLMAAFLIMAAFSMTACGGKDEIGQASPPVQTPQTSAQTASQAESRAESSSGEDDWQNPVMNFIGPYKAGDTEMLVEAVGKEDAKITVNRMQGGESCTTWVMSGSFDRDTFKVEYSDCVKMETVFAEDGSVAEQTDVYSDGTGRVLFNAQDYTIIWEDEKEHTADDLVFEFSYTPSADQDESSLPDGA